MPELYVYVSAYIYWRTRIGYMMHYVAGYIYMYI